MRRRISHRGGGLITMRIGGKTVAREVAVHTYRCAECLGRLRYQNAGLACAENPQHLGFIHQDLAEKLRAEQERQYQELAEGYEIINGQVMPKGVDNASE